MTTSQASQSFPRSVFAEAAPSMPPLLHIHAIPTNSSTRQIAPLCRPSVPLELEAQSFLRTTLPYHLPTVHPPVRSITTNHDTVTNNSLAASATPPTQHAPLRFPPALDEWIHFLRDSPFAASCTVSPRRSGYSFASPVLPPFSFFAVAFHFHARRRGRMRR